VKIEGITVCVHYADFFTETVDRMCHAVDHLFVVTTAEDKDTQNLCVKRPKISVVETDAFYRNGMKFSVGAGVNEGLKACKRDDWVLVLDADMALPSHTREALEFADIDPRKLYGVDRVTAWGRKMWDAVKDLDQFSRPLVVSPPLRLGLRVSFPHHGGWFPCGYFNLWHPGVSGIHDYPIHPGGTAEESDMMHAARWPRRWRELLPEIIAIQLATSSEAVPIRGANWLGRTTPMFD
jgi:Glycosyltransferase like family 2